jgi:hypothetical protein
MKRKPASCDERAAMDEERLFVVEIRVRAESGKVAIMITRFGNYANDLFPRK